MIDLIFQFGNEYILIRIDGKSVLFGNTLYGIGFASIDGLKLNRQGVEKEFPDLKDNNMWRQEAIKRFKDKINTMNNEKEIADYLINDLKKYGYIPLKMQIKGHRPTKL